MIMDLQEAVIRTSERVYENTKSIKQDNRQRRNRVLDLYGVEFYRVGDNNAPARFYISITPDLVYLERFEFKLIIQPFTSTAGSGTSPATVRVNDTSLTVEETNLTGGNTITPNPHDHEITPNPHSHSTEAHTHTINAGITSIPAAASGYRVSIEGIDVTPYLMAQFGEWVSGEGVWPSIEIERNYDILEVASDLIAEGRESEADILLRPGYKPIEISASGPFACTMSLYLKLSHTNR